MLVNPSTVCIVPGGERGDGQRKSLGLASEASVVSELCSQIGDTGRLMVGCGTRINKANKRDRRWEEVLEGERDAHYVPVAQTYAQWAHILRPHGNPQSPMAMAITGCCYDLTKSSVPRRLDYSTLLYSTLSTLPIYRWKLEDGCTLFSNGGWIAVNVL